MGYIVEPDGVDFFVDPTLLTGKDRKEISDVIAYYKKTGRKRKIISTAHQKLVSVKKQKFNLLEK